MKKFDMDTIISSVNLAEEMDEEDLKKIGEDAYNGYILDEKSREEFLKLLDRWTQLALQIYKTKSWPWKDASNVKYPLLATAAMQFAARAYPSLIPSNNRIVKVRVLGEDPTGEKNKRADRVSKFMSYQIMDEMDEWEIEMDKLLITLPIAGTVFKKIYWCPERERNVSCVVMPKDLVVNYWAKDLESAERITEILRLSKRKLEEKVRAGIYCECDLPEPSLENIEKSNADPHNATPPSEADATTPYVILEQHTFLDLDDDGYAEPYIVTFHKDSQKVLRVVRRFEEKDISFTNEGEIARIHPTEYYIKYGFIPNPDGGFYDISFGRLLGPINDAADTLINQLVDAGSMSNLQAGFIGKGLRMKMGENPFRPGEWKEVNATGMDLKQSLFPLPTKEPSAVLMQLLTFLIQSGKELASVAEIFVGKMPGQNTPATTTMATIEQGMKVFTSVYKRVFRSLTEEFRMLYKLNQQYLNPQTEVEFLDQPLEQSDFEGPENDIIPAADPASVSQQEKQAKVQAMMQLLPMGVINPTEFAAFYLDAFEVPTPERFLMQPQPQPDPEAERADREAGIKEAEANKKIDILERTQQLKEAESEHKRALEREATDSRIQSEAVLGHLKAGQARAEGVQKMIQKDMEHRQSMTQSAQSHQEKMRQAREKERSKPKKRS